MVFTSIPFFLFLLAVLLLYYILPVNLRKYLLIFASLFFYGVSGPEYLFLVLFVILFNYFVAAGIDKSPGKKARSVYLYASLAVNIGILVFYKYLSFILGNFALLLGLFQESPEIPLLKLALPLGISYYTFQNIGYILDVYRGTQKAEKSLVNFSLFVLFFPKLNVGPIERARNLLPQISAEKTFSTVDLVEGSKRILWGFFKKLVVADRIAIYVDAVFVNYQYHGGLTMLLAILLYTLQVYADFSGYTDIALGTARLFGFRLMENFNHPLLSKNVSDFWRRWHISLSSWVNDYLYNPISLKRRYWGNWGIYYALFISFTIIGIWHGATWNYILFGVLQSLALIYETSTRKFRKKISRKIPVQAYNGLSILFTYLFISFALILFKTPTPGQALDILRSLSYPSGELSIDRASMILFLLIGCSILIISDYKSEYKLFSLPDRLGKSWVAQQFAYAFMLIYILIAGVFDGGQFIYFQF